MIVGCLPAQVPKWVGEWYTTLESCFVADLLEDSYTSAGTISLILTFLVFGLFGRWLRQLKIKDNESNDQSEERVIVIPKRLLIYENDLGEETDDDMLEDWNYQRRARREERRFKEDSFELERTNRKIDRCEKELLSLLNERKAQEESIIPGLKKHIRRKNRKQQREPNNPPAEDRDGPLTAF